jgi:multidrug efflux pump
LLPVSPLLQVNFPTISVTAQLLGASPDVVAATVATPLERHLGQIADVTEMTSSRTVGSVRINLQFDLDRDINGAARDVLAATDPCVASTAGLPSASSFAARRTTSSAKFTSRHAPRKATNLR